MIKQKINYQHYCNKKEHSEFILYRYCNLCKEYFCSQCKCQHSEDNIYDFENNENHKKIKEIIEKVKICQKIINDEEKKFNSFMKEFENKIKVIKNLFEEYKKRNIKINNLYKLLINNYENFNKIRNYNINKNIIVNSNFDFSTSDYIINEQDNENNECLESKYNKLYSFYCSKLHIKIKEHINHIIIQKYCLKKKVKKCFIINEKLIAFFLIMIITYIF